ncbi:hypothetical protein MIR68_009499 [Amoeboaphelidium protococcarum]|nr:hypothetical protein MIR68_009499 [Amoeboaphelidium protococcarum]
MYRLVTRRYSSLAPMPTSRKTKSRHFLVKDMPHPSSALLENVARGSNQQQQQKSGDTAMMNQKTKLRMIERNPQFNHVLVANKEISKRERHFRLCLAMAQCANLPYLPDLTQFAPPPWLLHSSLHTQHADKGWTALKDPVLQSVYNTRLVKAFSALKNEQLKRQLLHAKVITPDDIEQVQLMQKRGLDLMQAQEVADLNADMSGNDSVSLFDKVMMDAERDIQYSLKLAHDGLIEQLEAPELNVEGAQKEAILKLVTPPSLQNKYLPPTATQKDITQFIKQRIIAAFGSHPTDFGSTRVRAALYTLKIRSLLIHLYTGRGVVNVEGIAAQDEEGNNQQQQQQQQRQQNTVKGHVQDVNARVTADRLCHERRKLLRSLRKNSMEAFMALVKDLDLKVI